MKTFVFTRGALFLVPTIVVYCMSTSAWAESQKLALPHVVEYSLQNNSDLKLFRDEKGLRDAAKSRAGVIPNPIFELGGSTGALTGNSAENSLSVGLSQELLLAGKRGKRLAVAERELDVYRWQLADRERLLLQEVKTAFYDVKLAEQRLILADSFTMLNKQLLDVTKARLEAGDIPELEMNLVKVEVARSEGAKIDAENTLNQNQARLAAYMGLPQGDNRVTAGVLESDLPMIMNLVELKRLALEKRPDLKALEIEKNKRDAEITLAKAEGIPNITAGLAVTRESTVTELGGLEGRDTNYIVGLKLSMPIPFFDRNQSGVQEARVRRSNTEIRLSSATRSIEREVETAYSGYLNTEKILALYRTNVIPQLEENLKLTHEAYRLGEAGVLSIIQEHKKYFEINEGYLVALHGRQTAFIKLESAIANDITGGVR